MEVLIPTYDRPSALAVTLTSLISQEFTQFHILIADQSETGAVLDSGEVQTAMNVLRTHGNPVSLLRNLPRRGMAQQRQFLLDRSRAPYLLFLDDDIILEKYALQNMIQAIQEENCGFVGSALIGLSHIDDVRPAEQAIEFWDTPVMPEQVRPDRPEWERHKLHNAANILHVSQQLGLTPDHPRRYKVAWVGGCVLYDTQKLRDVGGFSFWHQLPEAHAGEDVLAQLRVMDRYGGCGLIPSGVYHLQLPTTLPERLVDAPKYLEIGVRKNECAST